jgi:hypothetical protein
MDTSPPTGTRSVAVRQVAVESKRTRLVPRPTVPLNGRAVPANLRPKDFSSCVLIGILFQSSRSALKFPGTEFSVRTPIVPQTDFSTGLKRSVRETGFG